MAEQTEPVATTQAPTAATTGGAAPVQKAKNPKKIQQKPISKKRKFIKDGLFYAEINDYFKRELSENGYAGCEIRVTPTRTEIFIRATQANLVVGKEGQRIRELTALIQKKFKFPKKGVILFCEKVRNPGLSALAQAEAVKFRLLQGLSVRRAAYSVLKLIMDRGADGCEITISGKLRGQRAKSMKFRDGYMIHAGDAVNYYIDRAIKHVHLRQGVIGIRVKIMLPHMETDREGKQHFIVVPQELPDKVHVKEPKDVDVEDTKAQEKGKELQEDVGARQGQQGHQGAGAGAGAPQQEAQRNVGDVSTVPATNQMAQPQTNVNNENQPNFQADDQPYDYNQYQQQYNDYNDQQYNQQQYGTQYNTNQQPTNQYFQNNPNYQ